MAIATQQPDVLTYTKCDVQLIKVVPGDGLIQSKHVECIMKIKYNHKNFVRLVGLCTYCKIIHGAYNIKLEYCIRSHRQNTRPCNQEVYYRQHLQLKC